VAYRQRRNESGNEGYYLKLFHSVTDFQIKGYLLKIEKKVMAG